MMKFDHVMYYLLLVVYRSIFFRCGIYVFQTLMSDAFTCHFNRVLIACTIEIATVQIIPSSLAKTSPVPTSMV